MISLKTTIKTLFTTLLTNLGCASILSKNKSMEVYNYKVKHFIKVIDGDTLDIVVDLGFNVSIDTRLRLLGIDAPETRTKDLAEKQKGLESRDFLCSIIYNLSGKEEVVLKSKKLDSFGRSLGHLFINNENLSDIMLKNGHAVSR